ASAGLLLLTFAIVIMVILGSIYYTSLGVDLESPEGAMVRRSYYRMRWPGNGGLWFGGGEHYRKLSSRPIQEFDLACSAWRMPEHFPEAHTFWNRLGFWWIVN